MKTKENRLTTEELKKLRQIDFSQNPDFVEASDILAKEIGNEGSKEREEFDAKARAWYYGEILRDRRKELVCTEIAHTNSFINVLILIFKMCKYI